MKFLPCELIQDILPLYHDDACSEVSRKLVNNHLESCEKCNVALKAMAVDIDLPKLEADEGKPLKKIKRKWRKKTCLLGILIGVMIFFLWGWLTQSSSVKITSEEYQIINVAQFSNGMYYLEYQLPYDFSGSGADLLRTQDGRVYLQEYRPILAWRTSENGVHRIRIIDPENHRTDMGTEIPMTAFYLGSPDSEDAVLLWSAEEDYPLATPEEEQEHLYQFIFR